MGIADLEREMDALRDEWRKKMAWLWAGCMAIYAVAFWMFADRGEWGDAIQMATLAVVVSAVMWFYRRMDDIHRKHRK